MNLVFDLEVVGARVALTMSDPQNRLLLKCTHLWDRMGKRKSAPQMYMMYI